MEKEFARQQELQQMDETHRKEAEEKHQQEVKQHKQHEKLHHPGSKQQLEEVWIFQLNIFTSLLFIWSCTIVLITIPCFHV